MKAGFIDNAYVAGQGATLAVENPSTGKILSEFAVAMANDSRFGLSGYVHGEDHRIALDVALRIRTGTMQINGGVASTCASFGGQRASGFGRERGIEAMRLYQQFTTLNLAG